MGKFDEFDLDIKRSGNGSVGGERSDPTTFVTVISCDPSCINCILTDTCGTDVTVKNCSDTCSNCHSYCGGACRR